MCAAAGRRPAVEYSSATFDNGGFVERFTGLIGLTIVLAVALALSKNRKAIRWSTVGWAFALQMAFGLVVLYWERGKQALESFSNGVSRAIAFADQGSGFLFGWLAGPMDTLGEKTGMPYRGFIFAFKVLPIIIFICAFFSILYHFGIIQVIVKGMAWGMQKTMKVSGAEALCVAANVFIGQTEAPVLIAPYIATMTTSELLTMMTGGMAHVSGAVMLAYVTMGAPLKYLITASVMAAPGTFLIAKILWPETETPTTMGTVKMQVEKTSANFIDAAASGASQGMMLVLDISAMLIAFVALIAMLNGFLGWIGNFGNPVFLPADGLRLGPRAARLEPRGAETGHGDRRQPHREQDRHQRVLRLLDDEGRRRHALGEGEGHRTFALCGFANFSSIGIQIGGIGGLAPSRKSDLARLGFRALLAGSLVSFMTAAIAGILMG